MKIKTTMKYLTPAKIAIIKKSTNNKCLKVYGEKGSLLHCWWECKLVQSLWRIVWVFLKHQNRAIIWVWHCTSWHISRKKHALNGYVYLNIHCSTIYNSQGMKATSVFIERGMDKEDMVHIYNGILLNYKQEWNNTICSNMNGTRECLVDDVRQRRIDNVWHPLYVESKRNYTINLQNRNINMNLYLPGAKMGGRDCWRVLDGHVHTICN